ncbi:dihydrofolate reductase family protein [Nonomuraea sp. NPDC048826]|uniref:dihydrofolate reductase family protein n=1 Tax=Nonomuraea sp. NPDC048826 TaxID=3364347 RepID=UPI0037118C2B
MRKLIVANLVSLDGYVEGPGRDVLALPFDDAFDDYNAERLRAAGTLLLGRVTYEMLKDYWPQVADDPAVRPVLREISRLNGAVEKVVVSDSLTPEQTAPWHHNTRVVKRPAALEEVAALKAGPGGDILVFGSRTLWTALLAAGLVDELHLMVGSAFLGAGTPVSATTGRVPLRLLEVRRLGQGELALLRYAAPLA